jgi:hypothetical protein
MLGPELKWPNWSGVIFEINQRALETLGKHTPTLDGGPRP